MQLVIIGDVQKIEYIQAKINTLNNTAKDLGIEPISFKQVGVIFKSFFDTKELKTIQYKEFVYMISGHAPVLEGYEYLGKIEHNFESKAGNIIFQMANDVNLESFRYSKPDCTHCNTSRSRKFTHLLQKDGELLQVGSNCLADFLRTDRYLEMLEYYSQLVKSSQGEEDDLREFRYKPTIHVETFMDEVLKMTLSAGISITDTSKALLNDYLRYKMGMMKFGHNEQSLKYEFLAKCEIFERPVSAEKFADAKARNLAFLESKPNNFVHNLWIMSQQREVPLKRLNMAMWLVLSYFKNIAYAEEWIKRNEHKRLAHEQKEALRAEALLKTAHVGALGEEIQISKAKVYMKILKEGDWNSYYIVKLRDAAGLEFTIIGSNKATDEMELHETYSMTAKVKQHSEYEGFKQTQVWKVKNLVKETV